MEDRYQILEKIGQGGIGAVYRAADSRMNREVAIKRILPEATTDLQEEATAQLVREAGSLASLQHPNIVTVHDVGTDERGPYVVMEFIRGKTLDELITRAPLTWADFRELAMQSQEALIAAHDRNILHCDLKPSNVMLNWLPSGKFQVKLVDFGLAKFTPKPSPQEVDHQDAVFGSIFFMAPEQFERGLLDWRTDLYAIGCVYYHALAGDYPFNGATGPEVMAAHLYHQVQPLHEIRPDLPRWVADWVMWHMNRQPGDRPENARRALQIFLQNDAIPTPVAAAAPDQTMTTGSQPPAPESPKRPRLIIPGAAPAPEPAPAPAAVPVPAPAPVPVAVTPEPVVVPEPPRTQTAPQPLTPPEGSQPSIHVPVEPAPVPVAQPVAQPVVEPAPIPVAIPVPAVMPATTGSPATVPLAAAVPQAPAPQPLRAAQPAPAAIPVARPVAGGRLAVGGIPGAPAPAAAAAPAVVYGNRPGVPGVALPKAKTGMSNSAKATLAAMLAIAVAIIAVVFVKQSSRNNNVKEYNNLIKLAAKDGVTEIPVNAKQLDILLNAASEVGANEQRQTIYTALFLAKSNDGTDVDAVIAEFTTKQPMQPDVREVIIRDVLRKRANPKVIPTLLEYARTTKETKGAVAALQACRFMATDAQFGEFLEVIKFNTDTTIRTAAEEAVIEILKKSTNRADLGSRLASTYESSVNDEVRHSMIRLLARAGGSTAEDIVKKAMTSEDKKDQIAAIRAMGTWVDSAMFETLIEFLEEQEDEQSRANAFDSAFRFLNDKERKLDEEESEDSWKMLARNAKTRAEKERIIIGLANSETADWAVAVVEYFVDEGDDDAVIDRAGKALDRMRERAKMKDSGE